MRDKEEFSTILQELDGADFSEYEKLVGDFDFTRFVLRFASVGRDPGQATLFVVRVPQTMAGFPIELFSSPLRRTALEDFMTRRMALCVDALKHFDLNGIARRRIHCAHPGQKILPRSSVIVSEECVEARMYVDLAHVDGRIDAEAAAEVFYEDLPKVVSGSFMYYNQERGVVHHYVDLMEDADEVRQMLPTHGWVGFVGEGSNPARQLAADTPQARPGTSIRVDESTATDVETSNSSMWKGVGIPAGITVILGDDMSGRRELMRALASGVYNHIPGDGREQVVMVPDSVYVAAEPGRSIQGVDLTPFLRQASSGEPVKSFVSSCATAYGAQAASTVEALEVGARVLVFDESDSVPSFLSMDSRLAAKPQVQGIKPLCAQARQMVNELGISIVVGGCAAVSEFIPIADTVLGISNYELTDITTDAKQFGIQPLRVDAELRDVHELVEHNRWLVPSSLDSSAGSHDVHIDAPEVDILVFGNDIVDLAGLHQLAEPEQTHTIGRILHFAKERYLIEPRPIREVLDLIDRDLSTEGLDCLSRDADGLLARPRRYELAAALNRMPSLRVSPEHP